MSIKTLKEISAIISMVISLLLLSLWIVYYIVDNYVDVDSIFGGNFNGKTIYILKSTNNDKYIPYIKSILGKDYKIKSVKKELLNKLATKHNILLVLDAKELDDNTRYAIRHYVEKGGSLIFNYSDPKLIKSITKFRVSDILSADTFDVQTNLLSPLKVERKKINLYDDIYLYDSEAIFDFTKDNKSYGVMWSGNYAKGNWLYFSFPFYIIKDNNLYYRKAEQNYKYSLLKDMIDYVYNGYKVVKYPFVDMDKMVLVDEYIDYKFNDNFIKFLTKENIKATMFINPNIVHSKIDVSQNIEIASMSDVDKWKLQKYTNQTIVGYSNENDKNPKIDKLYNQYGFKYMLTSNETLSKIYYDDFVLLAYEGFNDITLEDDIDKIKKNIDFFVKYKIYTITIHSYILGYKDNFELLKQIITYAKKYPILTAKEVAKKYKDSTKIDMQTILTPSSLAIQITNNTLKEIENFKFRIYSKYKFDKIESNFFNINAKIIKETPNYVDIQVEKMKKNIEFYLRFKK